MLHFLLIGSALFSAYRWVSPRDSGGGPRFCWRRRQ